MVSVQFSHHNLYIDHALLAEHAPAYHRACVWLQTHGRAWFERATGQRGSVTISASWYRGHDYSTPHSDLGRSRHIAFIWHLAVPEAFTGTEGSAHEWDERLGGDLVWCEPYHRFPPTRNALYLFRVHEGSMHFVQTVWKYGASQTIPKAKRLAINGWFVLSDGAGKRSVSDAEEARLDEEGYTLYRQMLSRALRGDAASFVHRHD
jgi:Rps23 Pro-64 3,4-dihydroxylase Tpa1-like proline 4-hydroxylase